MAAPSVTPTRACLSCGSLSATAYCEECRPPHNFGTRHNPAYDQPAYRRFRAGFIKRWVRDHGMTCAGFRRAPHLATRLELDHKTALIAGGALVSQDNAQALCPSCNRAKSGRSA